ncbi:hypothetical protein BDR26DRAFT_914002 [Obelidium mucronatum]|nr:hypothetical protein BDR26DRAFT_914002 [Obelidium mucronatum]
MAARTTVHSCLLALGVSIEELNACSNLDDEFKIIKRKYHARVLVVHPDKPGGSKELFRQVNEPFEILRKLKEDGSIASYADACRQHVPRATTGSSSSSSSSSSASMPKPWDFYNEAAQETVPTYKVEPAKSDRSKCSSCKQNISKATIRIGSIDTESGSYGRWIHLDCWRVPAKIWKGLPDPDLCSDMRLFSEALSGMNEVLLCGFQFLSSGEKEMIVRHVMDKGNWAGFRGPRNLGGFPGAFGRGTTGKAGGAAASAQDYYGGMASNRIGYAPSSAPTQLASSVHAGTTKRKYEETFSVAQGYHEGMAGIGHMPRSRTQLAPEVVTVKGDETVPLSKMRRTLTRVVSYKEEDSSSPDKPHVRQEVLSQLERKPSNVNRPMTYEERAHLYKLETAIPGKREFSSISSSSLVSELLTTLERESQALNRYNARIKQEFPVKPEEKQSNVNRPLTFEERVYQSKRETEIPIKREYSTVSPSSVNVFKAEHLTTLERVPKSILSTTYMSAPAMKREPQYTYATNVRDVHPSVTSHQHKVAIERVPTISKQESFMSCASYSEDEAPSFVPNHHAIVRHSNAVARPASNSGRFLIPRPGLNGTDPHFLHGKRIVLTGIFPEVGGGCGLSLGKDRVKEMCESFGGRVTSAISGKTDFLIVGKEPGMSKVTKARESENCQLVSLRDMVLGIEGKKPLEIADAPQIDKFSSGYFGNGLAMIASREDYERASGRGGGGVKKKPRMQYYLE